MSCDLQQVNKGRPSMFYLVHSPRTLVCAYVTA